MVNRPVLGDEGYEAFLHDLKERIRGAQIQTALAVNRELILLYWQIGRDIAAQQQQRGWGAKVIDRLAADLRRAFPEMRGFSPRNLKYMRAFAEAYPDEPFVQRVVAQIPWGHNVRILDFVAGHGQADRRRGARADEDAARAPHLQPANHRATGGGAGR